jgi:hypothetical protein
MYARGWAALRLTAPSITDGNNTVRPQSKIRTTAASSLRGARTPKSPSASWVRPVEGGARTALQFQRLVDAGDIQQRKDEKETWSLAPDVAKLMARQDLVSWRALAGPRMGGEEGALEHAGPAVIARCPQVFLNLEAVVYTPDQEEIVKK